MQGTGTIRILFDIVVRRGLTGGRRRTGCVCGRNQRAGKRVDEKERQKREGVQGVKKEE